MGEGWVDVMNTFDVEMTTFFEGWEVFQGSVFITEYCFVVIARVVMTCVSVAIATIVRTFFSYLL